MQTDNFIDEFIGVLHEKIGPGFLDRENLRAADKRVREKYPDICDMQKWLEAEGRRILNSDAEKERARLANAILEHSGLGEKFRVRTFNTFECNKHNEQALEACIEIASRKRSRGVTIAGSSGIGKTHIAAAVVNAMAERGHKARFANIVVFLSKLKSSFKTGENVLKNLLDCEVLVIDDLGTETSDKGWVNSVLYEILNGAYEDNKTLIITTNLSERDMADRYSRAINSRIAEMCEWIEYIDRDRRKTGEFVTVDEPTPFDKKEE